VSNIRTISERHITGKAVNIVKKGWEKGKLPEISFKIFLTNQATFPTVLKLG